MVIGTMKQGKQITVSKVDYQDSSQVNLLIDLLDAYAQDPMGGAEPLTAEVKARLATDLAQQQQMFSLIVYVDGSPAGLCNCLWGYSTFAAKPLVNIHDLAVLADFRGLGLSKQLLLAVEQLVRQAGGVKITLEVLADNQVAQQAYRSFGFAPYELSGGAGVAQFWQYYLDGPT